MTGAEQLAELVPAEVIADAAAIVPTKPTKAIVGTVLAAVTTGLAAAATTLPEPYNLYATGAVTIIGVVATWFGIYLPANKAR